MVVPPRSISRYSIVVDPWPSVISLIHTRLEIHFEFSKRTSISFLGKCHKVGISKFHYLISWVLLLKIFPVLVKAHLDVINRAILFEFLLGASIYTEALFASAPHLTRFVAHGVAAGMIWVSLTGFYIFITRSINCQECLGHALTTDLRAHQDALIPSINRLLKLAACSCLTIRAFFPYLQVPLEVLKFVLILDPFDSIELGLLILTTFVFRILLKGGLAPFGSYHIPG